MLIDFQNFYFIYKTGNIIGIKFQENKFGSFIVGLKAWTSKLIKMPLKSEKN